MILVNKSTQVRRRIASLCVAVTLTTGHVAAQESGSDAHPPKIRGAIMMANAHVPKATETGKTMTIIPTWGFDFDYFFHRRWSVAFQGDIKLQSYEIEHEQTVLKRVNPITVAGVIHYHALRHWSFFTGPGIEYESSKSLFLIKLGSEYSFEVTENFEIGLNLIYESKENVYDSWIFGVAFNKVLWRKQQ